MVIYWCKHQIHLKLCVSSLRRGHANLLCIGPILMLGLAMGPPLSDQKVAPPSAPRSINPSSSDEESLAMAPPLSPERSSSVPFKVKPFVTLSDPDSDCNEIFSESNAIEFVDKHLLTTEEAQLLRESDSLTNFAQVCSSVSDDICYEFILIIFIINTHELDTPVSSLIALSKPSDFVCFFLTCESIHQVSYIILNFICF